MRLMVDTDSVGRLFLGQLVLMKNLGTKTYSAYGIVAKLYQEKGHQFVGVYNLEDKEILPSRLYFVAQPIRFHYKFYVLDRDLSLKVLPI